MIDEAARLLLEGKVVYPRNTQRNASVSPVMGLAKNRIRNSSGTIVTGYMIGERNIQICKIKPNKFFVSRNTTIKAPNNNPTPSEKIIVIRRRIGMSTYLAVIV